jgi:hypothetical protein
MIAHTYYPGWAWYDGGLFRNLSAPATYWDSWASSVRQHFPHKPFVISETGAGGIVEWSHNLTAATWTTKYQAEVLSRDVDAALASEHLSGVSLFQFFDIKEVAALESDEKRKLPFKWVTTRRAAVPRAITSQRLSRQPAGTYTLVQMTITRGSKSWASAAARAV